jgi:peroxiredoxin
MRSQLVHGILITACVAATLRSQQPPVPATEATFDGASGKVALKDYRGKQAVVLLFMRGFAKGMTCFYCGEQTREYRGQYAAIHAAGAEVIMVLPLAQDIAGYVRKIGEGCSPPEPQLALPFPVVLDRDGSACAAFHVPTATGGTDPFPVSTPATIVIDKDGKILFEQHGSDPSDRPDATKILEVLRTGKAPEAAKRRETVAPKRSWSSYEAGMRAAKTGSRPILLEFHAVW